MSIIQAVVLGLLQGSTEFIPVSSSGHLILIPWLLGWDDPGLSYNALVHLGTLVAVIVYLWQDVVALARAWWQSLRRLKVGTPKARLAWLIIVSAIPGGLMGYLGGGFFEQLFCSPLAVSLLLLVTGALLFASERLGRRDTPLERIDLADALLVGLAQGCAIAPGISRSGATICAGLLRNLERDDAARLSFLMAIPIIAGAAGVQLLKAASTGLAASQTAPLVAGFVAAVLSGYGAIHFLVNRLRAHGLRPFAYYCWMVGLAGSALSLLR